MAARRGSYRDNRLAFAEIESHWRGYEPAE